ncbi:hypothetical protein DL768_010347 [Monosporascus sp. mg162]|nr:hypothetical protein DL768_010347 [Monosporascus sp. mg162]
MPDVFCCSDIEPYRPRRLDHEPKFTAFLGWAGRPTTSLAPTDGGPLASGAPYAVQIVRQINFGPQESIRYFVPASNGSDFVEATEDDMLKANFEKLNSYKNFRCGKHNRYFELNLYQKNAINTHHWRVNLARPTKDIDLAFRQKEAEAKSGKVEEVPEGEETREPPPSNLQRKTSSPLLQAPQARHE